MAADGLTAAVPRALMIQGCGSDVGKSTLVAALARAYVRRGLIVRPFKPQNMSNNAAVAQGGEIGRAQAVQAQACGVAADIRMNPILLKPESEGGAQLVVNGQVRGRYRARDYQGLKGTLLAQALAAFDSLGDEADIVLVEGAGSPAEINLRAGDIANMGFAQAADLPVALVGDIDRGGVIGALVGCCAVLDTADHARLRGFMVNKFRGDPTLFADGRRMIADRTGLADFGLIPWHPAAAKLPAEDSASLARRGGDGPIEIAALIWPRIANFDDLDPLAQEPNVKLTLVRSGEPVPGAADAVILCGSKATRSDLHALYAEGWDVDLQAHRRRGGWIVGLCGGYQMLGRVVRDPAGVEGPPGETAGLGLLDVETTLAPEKVVRATGGVDAVFGEALDGYEIHAGRTDGPAAARPALHFRDGRAEGARSADGRVIGAYLHGLFVADGFRAAFLNALGGRSALADYVGGVDAALDALADHMETHADVDSLLRVASTCDRKKSLAYQQTL